MNMNFFLPKSFLNFEICDMMKKDSWKELQLLGTALVLISIAGTGIKATDHLRVFPFMLPVANLANTKWCKKAEKLRKPWHMGTHLRVLNESFPMNTKMTGFRWFSKTLHPCALDENNLSIGRVKVNISISGVLCTSDLGESEAPLHPDSDIESPSRSLQTLLWSRFSPRLCVIVKRCKLWGERDWMLATLHTVTSPILRPVYNGPSAGHKAE